MLICCECAAVTLPGSYFGHRCELQRTSEAKHAVKSVTVEESGVSSSWEFKYKAEMPDKIKNNNDQKEQVTSGINADKRKLGWEETSGLESDPHAGQVAPADPWTSIWGLCWEELPGIWERTWSSTDPGGG